MLILTPEEIRTAEANANADGLLYEEMMENAGMGCAGHILKEYPDKNNIVIICGKGKNGGDGFVIARGLYEAGKNVDIICAFDSPSDELSQKNRKRTEGFIPIHNGSVITKNTERLINSADIIIDAVFGIGFRGTLPDNIRELFRLSNKADAVRIATDIPSGLSLISGISEDCFIAHETLSMLCFKGEHIFKPFSSICGKTSIIPIGFSVNEGSLYSKTADEIKSMLPRRPYNANKGTFGKALLIAGSYRMPGAAIISAKGCLSAGAGLTFFAFPDKIYNTVTSHLTECVFRPLSSDKNGNLAQGAFYELKDGLNDFSAVAAGPGLCISEGTKQTLTGILKNYKGSLIIDADGINLISRNIDILKESDANILLTPHPGEMARLTGKSIDEIKHHPYEICREFSEKYSVYLLLKGENTLIASPDGKIYVNPTGSPALSRGGSGDLLTGLALSFAAQGKDVLSAGILAAYIHGLAGEIAEKKYTSYCATIPRITECIPAALSKIVSGK